MLHVFVTQGIDMAMKKLSALQSLLKHKFALLVAASAVTALFVVFAALPIIKFSGLSFVSSNLLKPNTAKANLSYDDGCSNAFWQWWISGSDEDYAVAEAMCSGGGGGGGVDSGGGGGCYWGDCSDEGGYEGGNDCYWGGCDNDYPGANEGPDYNPEGGPPMGTCWPGYNMDATGYCYPNGGVDDACHNPIGIDFEQCDPSVPYDPTPTLCSDPYYARMNINECGVTNVPDNDDPFWCDEINDDCLYPSDPATSPDSGPSSCKSPNGFTITCSDGWHCDTVNGGCVQNSTPVTTDGDPDGCDETHDNCPNPTPPTPPTHDSNSPCSAGFGYFERGGVWACYDTTYSAEHCADVNYALNNRSECGVVEVPSGPTNQDPIPVDPSNPYAEEARRCEDGPGFHWNYVTQRCVAEPLSDPCTTDLHYRLAHPDECNATITKCSDPYYAAGNPECEGVVPRPPPMEGTNPGGFTIHCSSGHHYDELMMTCVRDEDNSQSSTPVDTRPVAPTRDTGDDCVDEAGRPNDCTVPTQSTRETTGGRSLWDRTIGRLFGG